jgi:haloacetate dehalogenase
VFEGFKLEYVDVGEVTLRLRHGGDVPPVVPLHGHSANADSVAPTRPRRSLCVRVLMDECK